MLNLLEKWWEYKKSKKVYKTDKGYTVKVFASDRFAAYCGSGHYHSLNHVSTWFMPEYVSKYCVADREKFESVFGKIIGLDDSL